MQKEMNLSAYIVYKTYIRKVSSERVELEYCSLAISRLSLVYFSAISGLIFGRDFLLYKEMAVHKTEPRWWSIYLLPNVPKVGMTTNIEKRIAELGRLGIDISDYVILQSVYTDRKGAEAIEIDYQERYECLDLRSQTTRDKISANAERRKDYIHIPLRNVSETYPKRSNRQEYILQFDMDMSLIAIYDSVSVAADVNEISAGAISSALSGRQRLAAGSIWMYKPDYLFLPVNVPFIHK